MSSNEYGIDPDAPHPAYLGIPYPALKAFVEECEKDRRCATIIRVNPPIPQPGSILWHLQQGDEAE